MANEVLADLKLVAPHLIEAALLNPKRHDFFGSLNRIGDMVGQGTPFVAELARPACRGLPPEEGHDGADDDPTKNRDEAGERIHRERHPDRHRHRHHNGGNGGSYRVGKEGFDPIDVLGRSGQKIARLAALYRGGRLGFKAIVEIGAQAGQRLEGHEVACVLLQIGAQRLKKREAHQNPQLRGHGAGRFPK